MTQKALAQAVGVSSPYLHDLEKEARGAKRETLEKLASALGVTVDELIGKVG
jgi:transcriptional regulator with XRE-family HTH domain